MLKSRMATAVIVAASTLFLSPMRTAFPASQDIGVSATVLFGRGEMKQSAKIGVGQTIRLLLPTNPISGYRWFPLHGFVPASVEVISGPTIAYPPGPRTGSGFSAFVLRGVRTGVGEIRFRLLPPGADPVTGKFPRTGEMATPAGEAIFVVTVE